MGSDSVYIYLQSSPDQQDAQEGVFFKWTLTGSNSVFLSLTLNVNFSEIILSVNSNLTSLNY